MREKGFYWVFYFGEWTIAEYCGGYWLVIGGEEAVYQDEEFDEIGEKIERCI